MHEAGFKSALTKVLNDVCRKNGLLKEKDAALTGEDFREGLAAIIAIKMRTVQFEGQTKTKLGNTEARAAVEWVVQEQLAHSQWFVGVVGGEGVGPRAARQHVPARSAVEPVGTVAARHVVGLRTAVHVVVAGVAVQLVAALAALVVGLWPRRQAPREATPS